jgi:hypothetical protein
MVPLRMNILALKKHKIIKNIKNWNPCPLNINRKNTSLHGYY